MEIEADYDELTAGEVMAEGHRLLQKGDAQRASLLFNSVLTGNFTLLDNVRALHMAGVAARITGNLGEAEDKLRQATLLGDNLEVDPLLLGAIYRDRGAVHDAYYRIYRDYADGAHISMARRHLADARLWYGDSEAILERAAGPARLIEQRVTTSYSLILEWHAADEFPLQASTDAFGAELPARRDAKADLAEQLEACYHSLHHRVALNAALRTNHPDKDKHEVYVTNALIRVVRTEPLHYRLSHWGSLMKRTSASSASPGDRKRALVALLFGDRVYSWFELREARRRLR